MNKYTVLFGVLLCMVTANARHFGDRSDAEISEARDDQIDHVRRVRERGAGQTRHRRRSWQMNYGYEYPQPPKPFYDDTRREYEYNQPDLLPQIFRLLDEISAYVRRPPMPPQLPPQPIYVPYPVPYPVPQPCSCTPVQSSKPNITSRFPDMEDTNQNWGFADTNGNEEDEEGDGSRPISFVPIVPKQNGRRPAPKVDHGSSQAGDLTTRAPMLSPNQIAGSGRVPGMCEVTSLSCCSGTAEQQRQCFNKSGCSATYDNGRGCSQERLISIIDAYSRAYSPVN